MNSEYRAGIVLLILFAGVGAVVSLVLLPFLDYRPSRAGVAPLASTGDAPDGAIETIVPFLPPRPTDAPADIRPAVMLGYQLINETRKLAGDHVGNDLDCRSCHFAGGLTEGGRNGGLSLVGVAARYPAYRSRQNYAVDLATRTNDCFERSMNGRKLPPDSKEMTAIITYYHWISRGIPIYASVPWLRNQPLSSRHRPDQGEGRAVYARRCAMCHGDAGQGTTGAPPVWGDRSFNKGAGMGRLAVFAAFVHQNMPRGDPSLSVEQALDVAAFVTAQPRPEYSPR